MRFNTRSFVWFNDARRDLVHAARLLRRNPVLTITATLSLAIGIGANTTIFTVANALLLQPACGRGRPIPSRGHRQQSGRRWLRPQLVSELPRHPSARHAPSTASTRIRGFLEAMSVGGAGLSADSIFGSVVTVNYFTVLGAVPAVGRLFGAGDSDQPGASPVAVLSHGLWTRRFDKDPTIVGRTLRLNGHPFTVVGVAAEGFHGTGVRALDVWVPMGMVGTVTSPRDADRPCGPRIPDRRTIETGRLDRSGRRRDRRDWPDARTREPGTESPNRATAAGLLAGSGQRRTDRRIRRVADGDRVVRVDHRVRKRRGRSACARGCPAPGDGAAPRDWRGTRTTHPATAHRNGVAVRAWRNVRPRCWPGG